MKKPEKPIYYFKKIYPIFFWRECHRCNHSFKKEKMHKLYYNYSSAIFCNSCFEKYGEKKLVNDFIDSVTFSSITWAWRRGIISTYLYNDLLKKLHDGSLKKHNYEKTK